MVVFLKSGDAALKNSTDILIHLTITKMNIINSLQYARQDIKCVIYIISFNLQNNSEVDIVIIPFYRGLAKLNSFVKVVQFCKS